jgi:hypothetical protein
MEFYMEAKNCADSRQLPYSVMKMYVGQGEVQHIKI